jgi:hypothetical protein
MGNPWRRKSALRISAGSSRSTLPLASKCNEALSRDLWPLDPFESAPMRATSSGMGYCTLCAIQLRVEIKELAELLSGKAGRNSLTLKKLLSEIFPKAFGLQIYYMAAIASPHYS